MRTRQWLAAAACVLLAPLAGIAQCSNTMVTVTHETTVSGTGSMDPPYNFSFPMFDGGLGTLMEVRFMAVVTLSYSFNIENNSAGTMTSRVRVNRYDEIVSSALSQPISSDYISPQQSFTLGGSDGVTGSGPDYQEQPPIYILDHDTVINETVNAANFIGGGNISFSYTSEVGYLLTGNLDVSVGTQAHDEMKFIISYTYCSAVTLAPDVFSFTAAKNDRAVDLHWFTPSEQNGRQYIIEKSSDGQRFSPIGTVSAASESGGAGNYQYSYTPHPGESGMLLFRILVKNGSTSRYTAVRTVELEALSPTRKIQVVSGSSNGTLKLIFPPQAKGSWEVTLFSRNGQLIARKQIYNTESATTFQTGRALAPGTYVVSVVNTLTRERSSTSLIIK